MMGLLGFCSMMGLLGFSSMMGLLGFCSMMGLLGFSSMMGGASRIFIKSAYEIGKVIIPKRRFSSHPNESSKSSFLSEAESIPGPSCCRTFKSMKYLKDHIGNQNGDVCPLL
jgi:hypothetical protein